MPKVPVTTRRIHARNIEHAKLAKLCEGVLRPDPAWKVLSENDKIRQVCQDLVDLQGGRQNADYDHQASFTKTEVLALVKRSRQAVRLVSGMKSTPEGQLFLAAVWSNKDSVRQQRG